MVQKTKEDLKRERTNAIKQRYDKKAFKRFNIALHKENDLDIIEFLELTKNKNGFIKDCIRKCMNK